MPTLNIKNPRVYQLAKTLAEKTGRSMSGVIEDALEIQLAVVDRELDARRASKMAELDQIVARTAPVLRQGTGDVCADLHSEMTGPPR